MEISTEMLKVTTGSISKFFTLTTAGGQFESLQGKEAPHKI